MITVEQEQVFTISLGEHRLSGFVLESEWNGFKKYRRGGQSIILATVKVQSELTKAIGGAFKRWLDEDPAADEFFAISASPDLHQVLNDHQTWKRLDAKECHDLICMVYGAPWEQEYCDGLVDVLKKYEELRLANKRPVDPADIPAKK